ncbi:hypothetical protein CR513_14529, partial [Mucuna pruriens]
MKSGLIHLLPKFHGLTGEDPHKHLEEFHVVCSIMRSQGISEDYIKMKAFPFSLDKARRIGCIYSRFSSTLGLKMINRSMIDAASGEALMDKTPATTRHLISNMASNT